MPEETKRFAGWGPTEVIAKNRATIAAEMMDYTDPTDEQLSWVVNLAKRLGFSDDVLEPDGMYRYEATYHYRPIVRS